MSVQPTNDRLELEEVNRKVNYVYSNLIHNFDPAVKKLVEEGSKLFKALLNLSGAQKAYAEALEKVSSTAKGCHYDSKETGKCLEQLSHAIGEIQQMHDNVICWYGPQLLTPTESNVRQDASSLGDQLGSYHKGQKKILKRLKKDRKNGADIDHLTEQLHQLQHEGLQHALKEETKRYHFILERHYAWIAMYLKLQDDTIKLFKPKMVKWRQFCGIEDDDYGEHAEALALLDSAIDSSENVHFKVGAIPNQNGTAVEKSEEERSSSVSLSSSSKSSEARQETSGVAMVQLFGH